MKTYSRHGFAREERAAKAKVAISGWRRNSTFPLEAGDTFVLFSDGVSEAMNVADDFSGEDRLMAVQTAEADRAVADIVKRGVADVHAFANVAKQSDDIAVLAVRYAPTTG